MHNNFLYAFKNAQDNKPKHVILLHGCQIQAVDHSELNSKCEFGIELIIGINTVKFIVVSFFCFSHFLFLENNFVGRIQPKVVCTNKQKKIKKNETK